MYTLDQFDNPDLRFPQVVNQLVMVGGADEAPLFTFLSQQNRRYPVAGDKYSWNTTSLDSRRTQINNVADNYNAATTTLVVADISVFKSKVGFQVYCEATGERIHISSINEGASSITVIRGIGAATGGVAAATASVAHNAYLLLIASARGEATGAPSSRDKTPTKVTNYTQLHKRSVSTSGKVDKTELQTGNPRLIERQREFENWTRDMEQMLVYGVRGEYTDADGKRVTSSGGALQFISTNIANVGGPIQAKAWDSYFYQAFAKGSRRKLAIFGGTAYLAHREHWRQQTRLVDGSPTIGMGWEEMNCGYGTLMMRTSRQFVGPMAGAVLIIDPDHAAIADFSGREMVLKQDQQPNDADYMLDQWFGEHGSYWGDESCHMLIKGITAAG